MWQDYFDAIAQFNGIRTASACMGPKDDAKCQGQGKNTVHYRPQLLTKIGRLPSFLFRPQIASIPVPFSASSSTTEELV
jgi:hypothetical protein